MNLNKSAISALVGVALLAVPIAAAARTHEDRHNHGRAAASNYYRQEIGPRANYAPQVAANDWRWRDGDGWRNGYRNYYRPAVGANCPIAAPSNAYPSNAYP